LRLPKLPLEVLGQHVDEPFASGLILVETISRLWRDTPWKARSPRRRHALGRRFEIAGKSSEVARRRYRCVGKAMSKLSCLEQLLGKICLVTFEGRSLRAFKRPDERAEEAVYVRRLSAASAATASCLRTAPTSRPPPRAAATAKSAWASLQALVVRAQPASERASDVVVARVGGSRFSLRGGRGVVWVRRY